LQPSLEAQLCNLADEIAYNAHDIDDGVRSGLITMEQLHDVALFENHASQALHEFPELAQVPNQRRLLFEAIRRMLSAQVYDVIAVSNAALKEAAPQTVDDVRHSRALLAFGEDMRRQSAQLKQFLFHNLYRHPQVQQTTDRAKQVVRDLFDAYMLAPHALPAGFQAHTGSEHADRSPARRVSDYIAGMTDRFASREHERLTGQHLLG